MAVILLEPKDGRHIQDVVGAQQVAFNATLEPDAMLYELGYPAENVTLDAGTPNEHQVLTDADGTRLYVCVGHAFDSVAAQEPFTGEPTIESACLWSGGASGGPWLANVDPETGVGQLVAVLSGQSSEGSSTAGFFDSEEQNLYQTYQGLQALPLKLVVSNWGGFDAATTAYSGGTSGSARSGTSPWPRQSRCWCIQEAPRSPTPST